MASYDLQCQYPGCDVTFTAGSKRAKWCYNHKSSRNFDRDAKRLEERDPEAAAQARAQRSTPPSSLRSLRVAVTIGNGGDRRLAMELIGVPDPSPLADELMAEAEQRWPKVFAGDKASLVSIQHMGVGHAAVSTLEQALLGGPSSATTLRSAAQSAEISQTGGGKIFTEIPLTLNFTCLPSPSTGR